MPDINPRIADDILRHLMAGNHSMNDDNDIAEALRLDVFTIRKHLEFISDAEPHLFKLETSPLGVMRALLFGDHAVNIRVFLEEGGFSTLHAAIESDRQQERADKQAERQKTRLEIDSFQSQKRDRFWTRCIAIAALLISTAPYLFDLGRWLWDLLNRP